MGWRDGRLRGLRDLHVDVQLGLQLGDLVGQVGGPTDGSAEDRQRHGRGQFAAQAVGLLHQLGGPLQPQVALLRLVALGGQRLGAAGLRQVGLLAGELRVQRFAAGVGFRPLGPVGLEARQGLLIRRQLRLEQADLLTHGPQQAGVLLALGAIAMDGRIELLLGLAGAPVGAADGLLQAIGDGRLIIGHGRQARRARRWRWPGRRPRWGCP